MQIPATDVRIEESENPEGRTYPNSKKPSLGAVLKRFPRAGRLRGLPSLGGRPDGPSELQERHRYARL